LLALFRKLRHGPLSALRPLWAFLGRGYRRFARNLPHVTVMRNIGHYGPFRLSPEFAFSDLDNWGSAHNKAFTVCVEACRGKQCVLDVGAHVGFVSLPIETVLRPGGRIFAFEPSATNAHLLRRHAALNGVDCISVVECLVGADNQDAVCFYESAYPEGQNSVMLKREYGSSLKRRGFFETSRQQISLDSFCKDRGIAPEIIKIDVEGAEVGVLRGARRLLREQRPLLILSVHPTKIQMAGERVEGIFQLLSEVGYEVLTIEGRPVQQFALDEYIASPSEIHWQP
jgi:FkbM family methyltransferase